MSPPLGVLLISQLLNSFWPLPATVALQLSPHHLFEHANALSFRLCLHSFDVRASELSLCRHMSATEKHSLKWEVVRGADGKLFRRSIQAFVINEEGMFLAFTPAGNQNRRFRQTIQGGVDRGETPLIALARESFEEARLTVGSDMIVASEVLPLACVFADAGAAREDGDEDGGSCEDTTEKRNERDEIVDERRLPFRYKSKTWAKAGVYGQELYPFFLSASSDIIRKVQLQPLSPDARREFHKVHWLPLSCFVEQVQPSKQQVLQNILPAVYHAASVYWREQGHTTPLPDAHTIISAEYFQKHLASLGLRCDEETGLIVRVNL